MKLIRKTKKGFTLVELIVVIAIVAILAAVSVVSYIAFINQANLSADQQAITQMNRIVQADRILHDYEFASDAVTALYANGFNDGKLKAFSSNYHYAYSMEKNKWYLLNADDAVVYPEDVQVNTLWGLFDNSKYDKIGTVTHYIALNNAIDQLSFYSQQDNTGVFNEAVEYDLDLYHGLFDITTIKEGSTINLFNGAVANVPEEGVTQDSQTVEERPAVGDLDATTKAEHVEKVNNEITATAISATFEYLQNKVSSLTENMPAFLGYTSATKADMELVFENCTFTGAGGKFQLEKIFGGVKSITFKNCAIIGTSAGVTVIVDNHLNPGQSSYRKGIDQVHFICCTIKNSAADGRGINLATARDARNFITFDSNTFVISTLNDNGHCIQIADSCNHANLEGAELANSIVIKNNKFVSAYAVIRCHSGLSNFSTSMLSVSGNAISDNVQHIAIGKGDNESSWNYANQINALF